MEEGELTNITLFLIPAMTASAVMHPSDTGCIRTVKARFRGDMCKNLQIVKTKPEANDKVIARRAILLTSSAWSEVSRATICNCWRRGGLLGDPDEGQGRGRRFSRHVFGPECWREWIDVDAGISTLEPYAEEALLESVR